MVYGLSGHDLGEGASSHGFGRVSSHRFRGVGVRSEGSPRASARTWRGLARDQGRAVKRAGTTPRRL
eukprot:3724283-Rhodomonas_salina.2